MTARRRVSWLIEVVDAGRDVADAVSSSTTLPSTYVNGMYTLSSSTKSSRISPKSSKKASLYIILGVSGAAGSKN